MKQLDFAIGWFFVAVGALHNFVGAPMRYSRLEADELLWFISGGITLWLIGAMNLLRLYYAEVAPGLRKVCLAANIVVLVFSVMYAAVTGAWHTLRGILLVTNCAGAIAMTVLRPHARPAGPRQQPGPSGRRAG